MNLNTLVYTKALAQKATVVNRGIKCEPCQSTLHLSTCLKNCSVPEVQRVVMSLQRAISYN